MVSLNKLNRVGAIKGRHQVGIKGSVGRDFGWDAKQRQSSMWGESTKKWTTVFDEAKVFQIKTTAPQSTIRICKEYEVLQVYNQILCLPMHT